MSVAVRISLADQAGSNSNIAREPRSRVMVGATVRDIGAMPMDATIHDVSRSGCLVEIDATMEIGNAISIGISGIGQVEALVLRREGNLYGCQFMHMIPGKLLDAVQEADTVVSFTGAPSIHPMVFENTMRDPDRWHPAARVGVLGASLLTSWAILFGLFQIF